MDQAEELARIAAARYGHLATVRPDGGPHIVVVTFAMIDGTVVTAIDEKPKTTLRLQRLVNLETNPAVSFLVDHYDDDWTRLWWVRIDGTAAIHHADGPRSRAIAALAAKYHRYHAEPPLGPVIAITADRISSWAYSE